MLCILKDELDCEHVRRVVRRRRRPRGQRREERGVTAATSRLGDRMRGPLLRVGGAAARGDCVASLELERAIRVGSSCSTGRGRRVLLLGERRETEGVLDCKEEGPVDWKLVAKTKRLQKRTVFHLSVA